MNDTELELIIKKAVNIIRKKYSEACVSDIEDAISSAVCKYLEKNGSLDRISISWLVVAGERKLIDSYRRRSKDISLELLYDAELIKDDFIGLSDLKTDNSDLSEYADAILFPWLDETEDIDDKAA